MLKCTKSEKAIIKALHNTQIWTNIIYIIPSIFAYAIGKWKLATFGIIVSIVSIFHHKYNFIDAKCIKENNHKKYSLLSKADVTLSNILALYGIYHIYIKGRPLTPTFIGLFVTLIVLAICTFCISSFYYEPKAAKEDINSQDYIKNSGLYEHYHGYWHIFSGICYIITVLWLSL